MKFVTFEIKTALGNIQRIGVLHQQYIIDLQATYAAYLKEVRNVWSWDELAKAIMPSDMLQFIRGGDVSKEAARVAIDYFVKFGQTSKKEGTRLAFGMDEVKLKAPVLNPVSIIDCVAFEQHSKNASARGGHEMPAVWYEIPAHYRGNTNDISGHDDLIYWPSYTNALDYELEFALCIGKHGVNIPVEKAEEYIFGYTLFNDISARDQQGKEMALFFGPAKGKSFQGSNIFGPCIVTPDEININNCKMTARINGEVWSQGNSGDMYHKVPQLISYLSKEDPLVPGEFIGSGTVGFGSGMELNKWLKPGDIIELEMDGIGILRNRVGNKA